MLRCVRHAAFGVEVVPLVNWILITSFGSKSSCSKPLEEVQRSWNGIVLEKGLRSRRPNELSTRTTFSRDGTKADWIVLLV